MFCMQWMSELIRRYKLDLNVTGIQCKDLRTLICSYFLVPQSGSSILCELQLFYGLFWEVLYFYSTVILLLKHFHNTL